MATYASPASLCDASMAEMSARDGLGSPAMLASSHVLPSSRVTLIRPLFVPTQIVPAATLDGEIDSIAPPTGCGALGPALVPASAGPVPFGTPRSGLSFLQ